MMTIGGCGGRNGGKSAFLDRRDHLSHKGKEGVEPQSLLRSVSICLTSFVLLHAIQKFISIK
eukprot:scaffold1307_cov166-Ochromonas_danica.AAC.28